MKATGEARALVVVVVALVVAAAAWMMAPMLGGDPLDGPCSVAEEREPISCEIFVQRYVGRQPVVLRGHRGANAAFRELSTRGSLEGRFGSLPVRVSTANAFTGREWHEMPLQEYLRQHLRPQGSALQGNQTLYLFGSQYGPEWRELLANYNAPTLRFPSEAMLPQRGDASAAAGLGQECSPERLLALQDSHVSLSFGVAGRGTGVPFHFHGPGFLEQLHGRKRWFLYPPGSKPEYHPNETTKYWLENVYPRMEERPTHECVLEPGDVIYFPSEWMHATLNLDDYTAFVASFA